MTSLGFNEEQIERIKANFNNLSDEDKEFVRQGFRRVITELLSALVVTVKPIILTIRKYYDSFPDIFRDYEDILQSGDEFLRKFDTEYADKYAVWEIKSNDV